MLYMIVVFFFFRIPPSLFSVHLLVTQVLSHSLMWHHGKQAIQGVFFFLGNLSTVFFFFFSSSHILLCVLDDLKPRHRFDRMRTCSVQAPLRN